MARTSYHYTATVIGNCGHTCYVWPQRAELGGRNPRVVCETCTREKLGIPDTETMDVWVRFNEPPEAVAKPKRVAKPKAKVVTCSICRQKGHLYSDCPALVGQGTLFDG